MLVETDVVPAGSAGEVVGVVLTTWVVGAESMLHHRPREPPGERGQQLRVVAQTPSQPRQLGCALPNRGFERFRRPMSPRPGPMRGDVLEKGWRRSVLGRSPSRRDCYARRRRRSPWRPAGGPPRPARRTRGPASESWPAQRRGRGRRQRRGPAASVRMAARRWASATRKPGAPAPAPVTFCRPVLTHPRGLAPRSARVFQPSIPGPSLTRHAVNLRAHSDPKQGVPSAQSRLLGTRATAREKARTRKLLAG